MDNKIKVLLSLLGVIVLIVALLWVTGKITSITGKVVSDVDSGSDFYDCVGDSAVLYIIDGCSWCTKQKEILGEHLDRINYINCTNEMQKCNDAEIRGFPTWVVGGVKYPGLKSLEGIQEITKCKL